MELENRVKLSYYRVIGYVDESHGVRLVQHTESDRIFVLKTMKVYDMRVFRYLADHPRPEIPRIEELVEDNGTLYVVEDYVSGRSLQSLLEEKGRLEEKEALDILTQVCRILQPLHALDPPIVHRDIKPANLILTDDNRVVLIDFNSAKETRQAQAQDTVLIGTAGYAAPEQYGFSAAQPTADIYALGVLLSEMLTGDLPTRKPYRGRLQKVINTCLQMDPRSRYQTVKQLLRALNTQRPATPSTPDLVRMLRPWLPPGLRKKNLPVNILAALWYIGISAACMATTSEGASPARLWVMRCFLLSIFLGETLFLGNYRHVWEQLPLTNHRYFLVRLFGIAFWAVLLFFFLGITMAIVSSFFP